MSIDQDEISIEISPRHEIPIEASEASSPLNATVHDRFEDRFDPHGRRIEISTRRRLLLSDDDSWSGASENDEESLSGPQQREPGVVAKLMGLESLPGGGEIREQKCQLQELLRIREPFLLRELLRDEEHEECSSRTTAEAAPPSFRQKFVHLVRRRPAAHRSRQSETKKSDVVVNRGASSIKNNRGVVAEAAAAAAAVKIVPAAASSSGFSSISDSSSLPDDSSTSSSSSDEFVVGNVDLSSKLRKKKLWRSSSEPTLHKVGGFTKLSENISRRFGAIAKPAATVSSTGNTMKKLGLGRSKSDLGLVGTAPKKPHFFKETVKSLFNNRKKPQQQQQEEVVSAENSSLLKSLIWRRQRPSPKPSAANDVHLGGLSLRVEHQHAQNHTVAKKLQFHTGEDYERDSQSPTSSSCSSSSSARCTTTNQPSPVSVLDEIYRVPEETSTSGEESPDGKSGCRGSDEVQSESIINAIVDISRIRNIDLSSIGINRDGGNGQWKYSFDEERDCIQEIVAKSKGKCEDESWYIQGMPIEVDESHELLSHCVSDAMETRFSRLRRVAKWPWLEMTLWPDRNVVAAEAHAQICEWRSMADRSRDEVIHKDMRSGEGRWCHWDEEVHSVVVDVGTSLLDSLIGEFALELAERVLVG